MFPRQFIFESAAAPTTLMADINININYLVDTKCEHVADELHKDGWKLEQHCFFSDDQLCPCFSFPTRGQFPVYPSVNLAVVHVMISPPQRVVDLLSCEP